MKQPWVKFQCALIAAILIAVIGQKSVQVVEELPVINVRLQGVSVEVCRLIRHTQLADNFQKLGEL